MARSPSPRRSTRRARTTCTGTIPTSPTKRRRGPGCGIDPIVFPVSAITLHYLLQGALDGWKTAAGGTCTPQGGTAPAPQLTTSDFTTWKMVTIRQPAAGETPTAFYDLPTLRSTNELVLTIPRVGFFTTPAFFANWQTNTSNTMRVTTNQALIVGDRAPRSTAPTRPSRRPRRASTPTHAAPGTACFLVPPAPRPDAVDLRRDLLVELPPADRPDRDRASSASSRSKGSSSRCRRSTTSGRSLAGHPLFAQAWVQKLAYYANSVACDPADPEFQRIVGVFQSSGYSWNTLVAELLSSPLTTYASPTTTAVTNGEVVAVSRRDHLCAALNARLGFIDVCGLDALTKATTLTTIPEIVSGLPSDGYGRGSVAPVLPNQPTLFYRAGTENICEAVAALVIDVPTAKQTPGVTQWSSAQSDAAIADFVESGDGAAAVRPARGARAAMLTSHYTVGARRGRDARPMRSSRRSSPRAWRRRRSRSGCDADHECRHAPADDGARENEMISRRQALLSTLFGAGYVGLRALATGLPAAFLLDPRRALAQTAAACPGASGAAQFIILSTSGNGDPINASVPGTYVDPNIVHSPDPTMAPTSLTLAGQHVHGGGAVGDAAAERPRPHVLLAHHDEHAGPSEGAGRPQADGDHRGERDAPVDPRQAARPVPRDDPDAADQPRRGVSVRGARSSAARRSRSSRRSPSRRR